MDEIQENQRAIQVLQSRRAYIETKMAERATAGRSSYSMDAERTAIDFAVSALHFVIATLKYEATKI